ncbi:MAG: NADH:ubiquinone oxidoreductase subunit [Candidatus Midichloriaceae bacterium]|jgi:NADH:ubiquinone oxidoreductase subunit
MELVNWVKCKIFGTKKGVDQFGNIFYESNKLSRHFNRSSRWVYYKGIVEATKVGAQWFAWLHHQQNNTDQNNNFSKHIREVNLTGTDFAYHPSNDQNGFLDNYEKWRPKNNNI